MDPQIPSYKPTDQGHGQPKAAGHGFWPSWKGNKLFTVIVAIFMVYLTVLIGVLVQLNLSRALDVGKAPAERHNIMISGTGETSGIPDIAVVNLGFQADKETVSAAQKQNTETVNAFLQDLRGMNILSEDIQTSNYNIWPLEKYNNVTYKSETYAYRVSQEIRVKIRNLDQVSNVLDLAGRHQLNQVSGLSFEIDNVENLKDEARVKALEDAKDKAARIAEALGVKIVKVVSFSESLNGSAISKYAVSAYGEMGGGGYAPSVEKGSLDVTVDVAVTYEIE